jgi:AcrR family transcriptional regulator
LVQRRGPYQNGEARRLQIIAATTVVFGADGYVGGSLRRIAAQVGVTEPALLRHFGSKSGLLLATLAHWEADMELTHPHLHPIGQTPLGILRAQVARRQQLPEPRQLYAVITAEASTNTGHPARGFIAKRHARQLSTLSDLLLDASNLGEIDQLSRSGAESEACVILALLEGLELQCLLDPTADLPTLLDAYLTSALRRGPSPDEVQQASTSFS